MTALDATIYGIVQGLTEFIPVSSNAHLEIVSVAMTGHDIGAAFTAVIQWGTLAAVVAYFRHKVGVNSTRMVKISNLPSNMAAEHTQV